MADLVPLENLGASQPVRQSGKQGTKQMLGQVKILKSEGGAGLGLEEREVLWPRESSSLGRSRQAKSGGDRFRRCSR